MTTRKLTRSLLAGLFGAVLIPWTTRQVAAGETNAQTPTPTQVTVNALVANPSPHLDKPVELLGVVGVVTPGKGFVMVDHREFKSCGLSCLREKETKKIPVRWDGAAPELEQSVRVEGVLTKSADGLAFTAQKWVHHGKSG